MINNIVVVMVILLLLLLLLLVIIIMMLLYTLDSASGDNCHRLLVGKHVQLRLVYFLLVSYDRTLPIRA